MLFNIKSLKPELSRGTSYSKIAYNIVETVVNSAKNVSLLLKK